MSWHFVATTRSGVVSVFTRPGRTLCLVTANDVTTMSVQRTGGCGSWEASFPEPAPGDWLQFGAAPSEVVDALDGRWRDLEFSNCVDRGHWTVSRDLVGDPPGSLPIARFITPVPPPRAILMSAHLFLANPGEHIDLGLGVEALFERTPGGGELRWTTDGVQYRCIVMLAETGTAEGMRKLQLTACRTNRPVPC